MFPLGGEWKFENKPWQPLTSPAEVENASSFPFPHMLQDVKETV